MLCKTWLSWIDPGFIFISLFCPAVGFCMLGHLANHRDQRLPQEPRSSGPRIGLVKLPWQQRLAGNQKHSDRLDYLLWVSKHVFHVVSCLNSSTEVGDRQTCPRSYDSEGRLTNVTFPTGMVTSLHNDMSSGAVAVDIETSGRDEDVSITTNLSSVDSFYMLVQGTVSRVVGGGVCLHVFNSQQFSLSFSPVDQLRNSYQMGNDHSLRVVYANGMVTHYQTEPHILAGMLRDHGSFPPCKVTQAVAFKLQMSAEMLLRSFSHLNSSDLDI